MKVGLVSPYNMFKGGGVQECIFAIEAELIKRGHHAVIITPQPRNYEGPTPDNIIFLGGSTDFRSPFHTTAQLSATVNIDRLEEVLEQEQFDLLHFHEPWVPIVSRQILSRSNTVNVATFHAKLPDSVMSKTIERVITPYTKSILKYLDALTAVSEPAAEYVRQLTKQPIEIIPNGIDLTKYKPKRSSAMSAPTIFYVGRLEKRKGVKYLLMAFQKLQEQMPSVQLIIAGEGPERVRLEQMVEELNLHHVDFLGYIEESEKIHLMQSVDLFCAPAMYGESFGIVLLEALACGTPIVAGSNPGYASVLQERGSLGLVNPRDTDDFARKLQLMLTDEELRKHWKSWAAKYVKQFDYGIIVDKYEQLYDQLCASK